MLYLFKALLAATAALCLSSLACATGATWYADFDVAQKEAQKTGKDLLVDFTGSDWCGWCIKLHKEVFDFEAFDKGVESDFILVALDFPNSEEVKARVPNPERNDQLREQHGIRGYPTILLMTAQGEVYGQTGYQAGGPEAYVAHLAELRTSGKLELKQLSELLANFAKAQGPELLTQWDRVASYAEALNPESPLASRLVEPLKQAFQADPKNEQGRKLRAIKALFTLGKADAQVLGEARQVDPKNEAGLLEQALEAQFNAVQDEDTARAAVQALAAFEANASFKNKELAIGMYTNAARWMAGPLSDAEAAKTWAKKALELKPEDPGLVAMLEKIAAGA